MTTPCSSKGDLATKKNLEVVLYYKSSQKQLDEQGKTEQKKQEVEETAKEETKEESWNELAAELADPKEAKSTHQEEEHTEYKNRRIRKRTLKMRRMLTLPLKLQRKTPLKFLRPKRTCLGYGSLWYSWLLQLWLCMCYPTWDHRRQSPGLAGRADAQQLPPSPLGRTHCARGPTLPLCPMCPHSLASVTQAGKAYGSFWLSPAPISCLV